MKWTSAKPFSNGTEYGIFRYNYCDNCKFHKGRDGGFVEFTENGGCPIENDMEDARFGKVEFPKEIVEVEYEGKMISWHHCPFFTRRKKEMIDEKKVIAFIKPRMDGARDNWHQFDDHGSFGEYCAYSSVLDYIKVLAEENDESTM